MKKMKKNGIQCTTQYKFLNSIVHCVDFVVLCCLVGPPLEVILRMTKNGSAD